MIPGLLQHLLFTLKLNFRSKQALIYGYLVPILFLFAFAIFFPSGHPRLLQQMGELLTISALGGACFGMPTGMVADRERGVWRRYRLLPASTAGLVVSTMIARFVLVASAGVIQILLARIVYHTDFPLHPFQLLIAFTFVAFSFEAMGLIIAAAADNVMAVQALGMAIFLPMIMIGGIGKPVESLPDFAQKIAGFLPARYAVEAIQPCIDLPAGLSSCKFQLLALLTIGVAGCIAGARLFRWDANQRFRSGNPIWVLVAVASWIAVGISAAATGRLVPVHLATTLPVTPHHPHSTNTPASQPVIDDNWFKNLTDDKGEIGPLAPVDFVSQVPEERTRLDDIRQRLSAWAPGQQGEPVQRVRNLLSVAAVADIAVDNSEGPIARLVFDRLEADFDKDELISILVQIYKDDQGGTVPNTVPELDIPGTVDRDTVRDRDVLYGLKLLGRLVGKIPE